MRLRTLLRGAGVGCLGGARGLVVGPVVFAIDRRGGEVGGRRSGFRAALGALVVGGALEALQALATGRVRQPGFFTTMLVFVVGGAAASAGVFARARRQRHTWSGGQDLP